MADFDAVLVPAPLPPFTVEQDPFTPPATQQDVLQLPGEAEPVLSENIATIIGVLEIVEPGPEGAAQTVYIIQRIYDTTAGWVQYTAETFDPTPAPTATEPNHTGNLQAASHQKIGETFTAPGGP